MLHSLFEVYVIRGGVHNERLLINADTPADALKEAYKGIFEDTVPLGVSFSVRRAVRDKVRE